MGISFGNCHENSLHDSFQDQFDNVQGNEQFVHPYYDKKMTECFGDYHGLYDPMADYMEHPSHGKQITKKFAGFHEPVEKYMEKPCSGNGWLWFYSKAQFLYHNIFPLCLSFLVKHDEGAQSLDHLLDWLHWKSKIT